MLKIGVLISGGGTNLQAIINAIETGSIPNTKIVTVICSNPNAYGLERAKKHNIPSVVLGKKDFVDTKAYDQALISHLESLDVDLVVLAGFMVVIGSDFVQAFANRIMNIHPSLIPSFCGQGYYGLKVHEAALEKGVKITGATVHFVTEEPDAGPIILQKAVSIQEGDTPESLQKRVMEEAEWDILPMAIRLFGEGKLKIIGNRVTVVG